MSLLKMLSIQKGILMLFLLARETLSFYSRRDSLMILSLTFILSKWKGSNGFSRVNVSQSLKFCLMGSWCLFIYCPWSNHISSLKLQSWDNLTSIPKLWVWLWILNRLIRVMDSQQTNQGQPHVFFFAILSYSQSILYVTYLIEKSIFTTFTNVILGFPLPFFHSLNFNQLTLPHWCINRCSPHMSKTSQAILPHLFINRGHHYLYANFLITNSIFPCIFHLSIFTFSFYEHVAS